MCSSVVGVVSIPRLHERCRQEWKSSTTGPNGLIDEDIAL